MNKPGAKQHFKSVQLRNLSPEDSNIIKEAMKLNSEKRASQALLRSAKRLPDLIKTIHEKQRIIDNLDHQNKKLVSMLTAHSTHAMNGSKLQDDMKKLVKEINKTIDTRQTSIP